jgi:hypothetical protein
MTLDRFLRLHAPHWLRSEAFRVGTVVRTAFELGRRWERSARPFRRIDRSANR